MNYLTLMVVIIAAIFIGHRLNNLYVNILEMLQRKYRKYRKAKKQKILKQEKSNFQMGFVYEKEDEDEATDNA
jgi:hypothetical protein